jgi:hypothetical protein
MGTWKEELRMNSEKQYKKSLALLYCINKSVEGN